MSSAAPPAPQPTRRWPQLIGYLISALGLLWVFHDIRVRELLRSVHGMRWDWIALAVVFDVITYSSQGLRWSLLLRPIARLSTLRATQAIYAGLFTNEVLPMRLGEVVRAYLVSRWAGARLTTVVPSMVVERFFDAVVMAMAIGVVAIFLPLPKDLVSAAEILGGFVVITTAIFLWIVFREEEREPALPVPEPTHGLHPLIRLKNFVAEVAADLRDLGRSWAALYALVISAWMVVFQAMAFWLIMLAYGLPLSFWVALAVYLLIHLGTAIPNAPANVGSYQFFCVLGLTLFDVDKTAATGFSLVVFVILTIPLLVIGWIAVSASGTTLFSLRRQIRGMEPQMHQHHPVHAPKSEAQD